MQRNKTFPHKKKETITEAAPELVAATQSVSLALGTNKATKAKTNPRTFPSLPSGRHSFSAAKYQQQILIHTPHLEDKFKGTRMILDMLCGDQRIDLGLDGGGVGFGGELGIGGGDG